MERGHSLQWRVLQMWCKLGFRNQDGGTGKCGIRWYSKKMHVSAQHLHVFCSQYCLLHCLAVFGLQNGVESANPIITQMDLAHQALSNATTPKLCHGFPQLLLDLPHFWACCCWWMRMDQRLGERAHWEKHNLQDKTPSSSYEFNMVPPWAIEINYSLNQKHFKHK